MVPGLQPRETSSAVSPMLRLHQLNVLASMPLVLSHCKVIFSAKPLTLQ
jgi:hypothetical protein